MTKMYQCSECRKYKTLAGMVRDDLCLDCFRGLDVEKPETQVFFTCKRCGKYFKKVVDGLCEECAKLPAQSFKLPLKYHLMDLWLKLKEWGIRGWTATAINNITKMAIGQFFRSTKIIWIGLAVFIVIVLTIKYIL